MENVCPVCDYRGLSVSPYDRYGNGSDEICPSCGFQFGINDDQDRETAYAEWRKNWIAKGCRWFSKFRPAPPDWHPVVLTLESDSLEEDIQNPYL